MGDQWQVDRLDLEAYLARIGTDPGAGLADVHRAHLAAIPFENLDVMLGRGVSVDLPDVAAKLVERRRGGYCYEHGLLLGAALSRLGHDVERRLVRVGDPALAPRPRSHLVLLVRVGDEVLLADAGFGAGLIEPVVLRDGAVVRQGEWEFRTDLVDGSWRLSELRAGTWVTLYTMAPEVTYLVDVAAANFVTSTSPGSHFTHGLRVQRKDPDRLRSLTGRTLRVDTPAGTQSEHEVEDGDLGDVLTDLGLVLPAEDVSALVTRLPARA